MLLHNIMLGWAFLILLIVAATVVGLLTRKNPYDNQNENLEEPPKALFDFSAGQIEGHQMQKVLTEALAGTTTDAEFEQNFKAVIQSATELDAETSWAWLGRFLMEYRQANEFEPSPRHLAERFLADIPHRYKLKDLSPEPTQPSA